MILMDHVGSSGDVHLLTTAIKCEFSRAAATRSLSLNCLFTVDKNNEGTDAAKSNFTEGSIGFSTEPRTRNKLYTFSELSSSARCPVKRYRKCCTFMLGLVSNMADLINPKMAKKGAEFKPQRQAHTKHRTTSPGRTM